jgi:hypothetical protein
MSGWGRLEGTEQNMPQILQVVVVPLITYDTCSSMYSYIDPGMICAGESNGGKDACVVSMPSLLTS